MRKEQIMRLSDKFVKDVVTASPEQSLASAAQMMKEHNVGTIVVVARERPIGILTDRDLALAFGVDGLGAQTPIRAVMTTPITTIGHDKDVYDATWYMQSYQVRRLPIVNEDGRLVGIVTLDDLLKLMGHELSNLAEGIQSELVVT
jgi:CBS domain-containing protein